MEGGIALVEDSHAEINFSGGWPGGVFSGVDRANCRRGISRATMGIVNRPAGASSARGAGRRWHVVYFHGVGPLDFSRCRGWQTGSHHAGGAGCGNSPPFRNQIFSGAGRRRETVYFGGRDRNFYAIDHAGREKWSFRTGDWIDASPAIASNGVVCFGGWDHKFYALNPDGSKRWEFSTGGPVDSSPATVVDGTIYFGSHDKKFYALSPEGKLRWAFPTDGAVLSSPAINCDGTIYFTSADGRLYALNPDGSQKWALWTGGVRESSPVIGGGGNIYLGVNDSFGESNPTEPRAGRSGIHWCREARR